jgi:hypothetical protein
MPKGAEFSITASYAKLVWPFVSKDKERYYLNGFHVYKHPSGGAIIAGSDSISIGVFWDPDGDVSVPAIVRLNRTTLAACAEDCAATASPACRLVLSISTKRLVVCIPPTWWFSPLAHPWAEPHWRKTSSATPRKSARPFAFSVSKCRGPSSPVGRSPARRVSRPTGCVAPPEFGQYVDKLVDARQRLSPLPRSDLAATVTAATHRPMHSARSRP